MPTPQIAAVGEDQPADERRGPCTKLVADDVFQAVPAGFRVALASAGFIGLVAQKPGLAPGDLLEWFVLQQEL